MAVVTPTDRPESVRNRCVIEVFGGVLCVVILLWVGAFVIGLGQISSFFPPRKKSRYNDVYLMVLREKGSDMIKKNINKLFFYLRYFIIL